MERLSFSQKIRGVLSDVLNGEAEPHVEGSTEDYTKNEVKAAFRIFMQGAPYKNEFGEERHVRQKHWESLAKARFDDTMPSIQIHDIMQNMMRASQDHRPSENSIQTYTDRIVTWMNTMRDTEDTPGFKTRAQQIEMYAREFDDHALKVMVHSAQHNDYE